MWVQINANPKKCELRNKTKLSSAKYLAIKLLHSYFSDHLSLTLEFHN